MSNTTYKSSSLADLLNGLAVVGFGCAIAAWYYDRPLPGILIAVLAVGFIIAAAIIERLSRIAWNSEKQHAPKDSNGNVPPTSGDWSSASFDAKVAAMNAKTADGQSTAK